MEPVNKHSGTETESYHDFGSMCLLIGKKTLGSNRRCRKKSTIRRGSETYHQLKFIFYMWIYFENRNQAFYTHPEIVL